MPVFDTFRINHAHLGKVMVERTKFDNFNDTTPQTVKSTDTDKRMPFEAWRRYISRTLKTEKSLTSCAVEHTFA
jgi:hypothetical protein